jgi:hypothetical protein
MKMSNVYMTMLDAMEADDLTVTTDELMKRASGSRADQGSFEPPKTSEETQQQNGANVDRGAMSGNTDALEPGPDGAAQQNQGQDPDLGLDTMEGGGDDMGGEDMGGDMGQDGAPPDDGMGGEEEQPSMTPEQSQSIVKLQQNMSQFYRVLSSTISSLGDYSAPSSSEDLRKIFNGAMDHLTRSKELLLDLLTTDFTPGNYAEKLRKYVALRHVYSAVLEMLDLHFNMLDQENKKTPQ